MWWLHIFNIAMVCACPITIALTKSHELDARTHQYLDTLSKHLWNYMIPFRDMHFFNELGFGLSALETPTGFEPVITH
jgi:hypothetical protein